MTNKSKKSAKYFDKNPIEAALRNTVDEVVNTVKDDVLEESVTSAWHQLLGGKDNKTADQDQKSTQAGELYGDLEEGQELDLRKKQQKLAEKLASIEAGYDYKTEILHFEEKESRETEHQTSSRIQEILVELKQLSTSVKELEIEVKDVSMDIVPVKAGKYHETFFEYLLNMLKNARLRVENSANWLQALTSKKSKKGYWANAKAHGTSYTLSADRIVAQQVG
jgi:hypothetical protein